MLWDEFRGHTAKVVEEYCTSLPFLKPEIIPGGLTLVAQPLDKVMKKIYGVLPRHLRQLHRHRSDWRHRESQISAKTIVGYVGCRIIEKNTNIIGAKIVDSMWISAGE